MVTLPTPGPARRAFDLVRWRETQLLRVEQALEQSVDAQAPAGLGLVMRYAVQGGGKRLRPLLVLAAAQALAAAPDAAALRAETDAAALRAACAVELIHAYSLVHDDLPCMDNDVLRRGKPTTHVQFGQAQALLAGDALQALAFELLTPDPHAGLPAALQARLCALLARAAGANGMAGGQAIDLASIGQALTEPQLRTMHRLKTGALLLACVQMGAACGALRHADGAGNPLTPALQAAFERYGRALGLAFQVVDDVLDVTADSATLGKTAGKDAAQHKPTFVSLLGLAGAQAQAQALLAQALAALDASGLPDTQALRALAHSVVERSS